MHVIKKKIGVTLSSFKECKMISIGSNITFRRLEEKDLRLMHKWLNTDFVHKGLGEQILIKFLSEYVFQLYDVECCIIGPEPKNNIAIRAYEKAGFKYFKTIQVPDEDEPEYLMRIYKNEVNSIINSQGGLR